MHGTVSHDHDHVHNHDQDHDHDGPHAHAHDGSHAHSADGATAHSPGAHAHSGEQAPKNLDDLVLDIGADTGALIIRAAVERDQAEIEISPVGTGQARTHNIVRRREAPSGAVYAAVFPAVPAGDYVVWRDAATPAGTVSVEGGRVASFRLS